MDSIQAVREAIESLSTDEKIDEGQYLVLMNHLKSVYEKLERSERKEDEQKEDIPRGWYSRSRMVVEWIVAREELFHNLPIGFFPIERDEVKVGLVALRNALIPNGALTFRHHTMLDIPEPLIRLLLRGGVKIWKDLEVREIFFTHATVRRLNLERVLERRLYIEGSFHYKNDMTEEDWAKALKGTYLPFTTTKRVDRRGEFTEIKSLEKLHPITLTFHFTPTRQMEIHLYTDKIQLGRSDIIPRLSQLMLQIIRVEGWTDVPLEKIIKSLGGMSHHWSEKKEYPKMKVSGITAHTRAKRREYDCGNGLMTITYREKYAK